MGYRIGSFNLMNLGLKALGNKDERDLGLVARIIKSEAFDVVALQEVLSEGKALYSEDYAKKSILMHLGNEWDFSWANAETDQSKTRNEGYAFVWNKKRLRLASTIVPNQGPRIYYPRICKINKTDMQRRPYYARFTPVGTGGSVPWIEIRLLCIHTYWGKDNSEGREKRDKELDVILKDIYPQISDRRYGEYGNGMPSYTLVLGDYNVQLRRPWKDKMFEEDNLRRVAEGKVKIYREPPYLKTTFGDYVETTKWGHRYIKTVQDQLTTLKSIDDNEKSDDQKLRGYSHDYDHFSFEEKQFEGVGMKVRRVDAVRKYCNDDFAEYHSKVSDHIPILMDIEFKDDFETIQQNVL